MSRSFHPLPKTMPIDAAADLMVRRGECSNFFLVLARARLKRQRARHGTVEIDQAGLKAAFSNVEPRLPYKD